LFDKKVAGQHEKENVGYLSFKKAELIAVFKQLKATTTETQ